MIIMKKLLADMFHLMLGVWQIQGCSIEWSESLILRPILPVAASSLIIGHCVTQESQPSASETHSPNLSGCCGGQHSPPPTQHAQPLVLHCFAGGSRAAAEASSGLTVAAGPSFASQAADLR